MTTIKEQSKTPAQHAQTTSKLSAPNTDQPKPEPYIIFDKRQKVIIVAIVSTAATFSGFASNIYFPALPALSTAFNVSPTLINLTITSYLVFQALAPSLWGPISDVKGRRPAYTLTFLVFLGACIGLAETKTYAGLVVLRCLQSTGSASTIAIGAGVIGDISTRAERGGYMGVFQAGLLAPVAVGPVIGGALAGSLGWRSIFWFLVIFSGVFLVSLLVLLPETLRSVVGNGSSLPSGILGKYPLNVYQKLTKEPWGKNAIDTRPPKKHVDVTGPLRILTCKQAAPIIFFLAIYYAVWQMSITAMSTLFKSTYGLGETQVGLTFIANGVGSIIGTLITGKILDFDYHRVKARYLEEGGEGNTGGDRRQTDASADFDNFPLEKARMRLIPIFAVIQWMSIVVFGWTVHYAVHIAVPIVSTFVTGWTVVSTQSVIMTYLVDVFPDRSAAASASLNLARCLLAAGGTSIVMPIANGVGVGWTFTICALVQVLAMAAFAIQWKFGAKWRGEAALNKESSQ